MKLPALGLLLLLGFGGWGCQTLESLPTVPVSERQRQFFGSCDNLEGGGRFTVREGGNARFSSRYDWVTDAEGRFQLEISDVIGRTVADLEVNRGTIVSRAKLARKLTVGAGGFLEFDGHSLGISVNELGCILGMRFPERWLEHEFRRPPQSDKRDVLATRDGERTIFLTFPGQQSLDPACARITWRRMIFGEGAVKFCFKNRDAVKSGTLEFEQFEADWHEVL